jgi:hypothetical protein
MLERILRLFVGRATVTNRVVQAATGTLEETLAIKGFLQIDKIPQAVRLIIIQEALRKASEKETDGCARMGEFNDQIESAADNIIAAFNGDENADPRIKNILIFHKVLSEPNASNARPE